MDRTRRSLGLAMLGLVMALVVLGWAAVAGAQTEPQAEQQTYPKRVHRFISDFAMVIPEKDEQALVARLEKLRSETGVEMAVVSLNGIPGGEAQLETYATGLFNAWGIGDGERNNGVLLLFSPRDRAVRLELGRAYGQGYDVLAQDIVSRALVPAFRDSRYREGVADGIGLVRNEIALPFSGGGLREPSKSPASWMSYGVPAVMVMAFGAIILRKRRGKTGPQVWPQVCPQCGTPLGGNGLSLPQKTQATCTNCGWRGSVMEASRHERPDPVGNRRADAEGGSGGGSSSGGGASGRW